MILYGVSMQSRGFQDIITKVRRTDALTSMPVCFSMSATLARSLNN